VPPAVVTSVTDIAALASAVAELSKVPKDENVALALARTTDALRRIAPA
jgi:hypothetical protein